MIEDNNTEYKILLESASIQGNRGQDMMAYHCQHKPSYGQGIP